MITLMGLNLQETPSLFGMGIAIAPAPYFVETLAPAQVEVTPEFEIIQVE
jgi:hypothetical protein